MGSRSRGKLPTSRRELSALAGAAVVISVLGAELGASVGEAASPSSCATEALGVKAGFGWVEKNEFPPKKKKKTQLQALPVTILSYVGSLHTAVSGCCRKTA